LVRAGRRHRASLSRSKPPPVPYAGETSVTPALCQPNKRLWYGHLSERNRPQRLAPVVPHCDVVVWVAVETPAPPSAGGPRTPRPACRRWRRPPVCRFRPPRRRRRTGRRARPRHDPAPEAVAGGPTPRPPPTAPATSTRIAPWATTVAAAAAAAGVECRRAAAAVLFCDPGAGVRVGGGGAAGLLRWRRGAGGVGGTLCTALGVADALG